MSDCLTPEELGNYRSGRMAGPEALVAADAHLSRCHRCRAALVESIADPAEVLAPWFADTGTGACIDPEALAAYLAGEADAADREILESHLQDCRACAGELDLLRDARAELAGYDWEAARAAARLGPRRQWSGPVSWVVPRPAFAALCAGILLAAALVGNTLLGLRQDLTRERMARAAAEADLARLRERRESEMEAYREQLSRPQASLSGTRTPPPDSRPPAPLRPSSPPARILTDAGGPVILDSRGRLSGLPELSSGDRRRVASALRDGALELPDDLASLRGRSAVLLGGDENAAFALRAPVAAAVRSPRPVWSWQPLPEAVSYRLVVVEDESHREVVQVDLPAPAESDPFFVPEAPVLEPGAVYRWYVVAATSDGRRLQSPTRTMPPAKFRVLSATEAKELGRSIASAGASRLARGVVFARFGLLPEAEAELRALQASNPDSDVPDRLLRALRAARAHPPSPTRTNPAQ